MKTSFFTAAVAMAALCAAPAQAADVGVSVQVSQPGLYGRIDIGKFPEPAVVLPQPVIIQQPRVVPSHPVKPLYLWVPPGHQKNWAKHCSRYNACGAPVYFVKDDWYQQHVMKGRSDWSPPHQGGSGGGDHRGDNKGDKGEKGNGKGHGNKGHGKKD